MDDLEERRAWYATFTERDWNLWDRIYANVFAVHRDAAIAAAAADKAIRARDKWIGHERRPEHYPPPFSSPGNR